MVVYPFTFFPHLAIPAPTVITTKTISPSLIVLDAEIPVPAITIAIDVTPAALTLTASLPIAITTGCAEATPAAITMVPGFPALAITGLANFTPDTVGLVGICPDVLVTFATTPAAIAMALAIPVVSITGGAIVSPIPVYGYLLAVPDVQAGWYFIEERPHPLVGVGTVTPLTIAPDFSFQIGTPSALFPWYGFSPTLTKVGYDSTEAALYITSCDPNSSNIIYHNISPSISHHEYSYLKFSIKGGSALFSVKLYTPPAVYGFSWDNPCAVTGSWVDVSLQIGPSAPVYPNGWNPYYGDWHNIAGVGFWVYENTVKIKNLRFEGSTYIKTLEDATSQASYEIKFYPESVPFQLVAETDAYAAKILAAKKDPQSSISVRANGIYTPTLYTTVAVTLGGMAYNPTVIGYDIDPIRKQTKFIFDAYSARDLVAVLNSLNKELLAQS